MAVSLKKPAQPVPFVWTAEVFLYRGTVDEPQLMSCSGSGTVTPGTHGFTDMDVETSSANVVREEMEKWGEDPADISILSFTWCPVFLRQPNVA